MVKSHLQHALKVVRRLRTWQLVLLALVMTFLAVITLRANSLEAAKYFQAVKVADEKGENVDEAMGKLQEYVSHHMNTDLERVTLSSTYERDYQKAVTDFQNSGGNIGVDEKAAIATCAYLQKPGVVYYQQYSHCVENILKSLPSSGNLATSVKSPQKELYEFHFSSPGWSPDLAGFTSAIALILWLIIAAKLFAQLAILLIVRYYRR